MYVKEVLVQNKAGLHARPATFFIQKANEYKSTIGADFFTHDVVIDDVPYTLQVLCFSLTVHF